MFCTDRVGRQQLRQSLHKEAIHRPRTLIYPLATAVELMAELGKLIMLTRSILRLSAEELAKASQWSVEEIERMESAQRDDLLTLLRIAQVLHYTDALMTASSRRQPAWTRSSD